MRVGNEKRGREGGLAGAVLYGALVCVVFELLIFIVASVFVSRGILPESAISMVTVITAGLGAFVGALFAARRKKAMYVTVGLAVGASICVLMLILSAFGKEGGIFSGSTPAVMAALILGGALGGLTAARHRRPRRR